MEYYTVPPEDTSVIEWDKTSSEAFAKIEQAVLGVDWWDTFTKHLAQEKSVDYLAADVCMLLKSIFQVFEDKPLDVVLPIVDAYLADSKDRHKQRAAGELLGGLLRGSKHWPMRKQRRVWEWLSPKLPKIFDGMTPDTQPAWNMMCDCELRLPDLVSSY